MKTKKLIPLVAGLIIPVIGLSQSCLPQGITFNSQTQIDSFQINYPNCTQIEGDVTINGNDINNLNGLNVITSINGSFILGNYYYPGNNSLSDLTGLNNLVAINGDLEILYNDALTSLAGLDNLTAIGGNYNMHYNFLLTDITALNNLNSIEGQFCFDYCGLTNLQGLEGLNEIGDDLYIHHNNELINLTGLNNLTSIGGYLVIYSNENLINLSGLENLNSIGEFLAIDGNDALFSLSALQELSAINGNLIIQGNSSLIDLSGLDNINALSIIDLTILHNHSLCRCSIQSICEYLSNPNGNVVVLYNASGCNSPEEVEGECIAGNEESENSICPYIIYPNPTTEQLTIEKSKKLSRSLLLIHALNGIEVLEKEITEPQTIIDLSHLSQGVYLVEIINNKTIYNNKLIKF